MKLCKDCRHYIEGHVLSGDYCGRDVLSEVDIVTGRSSKLGHLDCRSERRSAAWFFTCTRKGKYWEAKDGKAKT